MSRRQERNLVSYLLGALLVILFTLGISECGHAWSENDTDREVTWQVINFLDYRQTVDISKREDKMETNPILGKYPSRAEVDRYFALAALTHYGISRMLPFHIRRNWQWLTIGISGGIVYRNYTIGLKFNF